MTEVKKNSSWTLALKQWNESNENKVLGKTGKAKFIIPKKGSTEFDQVKKISDSIKASQPPKPKRTKKPAQTEPEPVLVVEQSVESVPVPVKKTRKKKVQAEVEPKSAPDLDTILQLLGAMKN
jgi:hypothetical protein